MESASLAAPLCESLERQVRDQARRVAIHSEGERRSLTFADVGSRVAAWAAALRRAGVQAGQTVALAVGNVPAFVELFFAIRSIKAAVLALDEDSSRVAAKMGASWIAHRTGPEAPIDGAPDRDVRLSPLSPEIAVPERTALVRLTSGSTLAPRGACFTEEALQEGIDHILRGMDLDSKDRVLVAIPMSHAYGFDSAVLSLGVGGTPISLQPDVLPAALIRTIQERGITFFPAVPALIRALGQVAWPKPTPLRRVVSASAPLSQEAADAFARASGHFVSQFFGATECGGLTFERHPDDPAAAGSVGVPLPGIRVELVEGDLVRIHSAANRFAIIPEQPVAPYVDTGDRGAVTPEGRLRLLGRATLVANIAGFKVDLGALEAFFRTVGGVDDAAALAVEDAARGQRVLAYVETSSRTEAQLMDACRAALSAREVPSEIRVVARLPRTGRGKLDRSALAAQAGKGI